MSKLLIAKMTDYLKQALELEQLSCTIRDKMEQHYLLEKRIDQLLEELLLEAKNDPTSFEP